MKKNFRTYRRSWFGIAFVLCLLYMQQTVQNQSPITVCNSGCTFPNTNLQGAINAVAAGGTVLLQEGFTYVGDYTFSVKSGAGPSAKVTIRTGVDASGNVQSTTRYPATGIRVCPSTYNVDWMDCSTRNPYDMTRYAKMQPAGNNAYGLKSADTASGTPVSYYDFQWIEFIANTYAGNSIVALWNETNPNACGSACIPHHFTFDQIVMRGDPVRGQFRGFQLNGNFTTIKNSFIYDIKAMEEGQALWINTSTDTLVLENNYISGGTEVLLTGGSDTTPSPTYTVQASPTPSTTVFAVDRVTDLYVGKQVAVKSKSVNISSSSATTPAVITTASPHGYTTGDQVDINNHTGATCSGTSGTINSDPWTIEVLSTTTFALRRDSGITPLACSVGGGATGTVRIRASAEIATISGNTLTVTPALRYAPASGDTVETSLVLNNLTVRYNVFTRPSSYRTTNIVPTPTGLTAQQFTTGGSLSAGTYCYRVLASYTTARAQTARSAAAAEQCQTTTGTTSRVDLSWTAVPNAETYTVYGRASGAQNVSWTVTAPTTTFSDTGASGTGGSVPSTASIWQVKNTFELKHARNVLMEYNLVENAWLSGQVGSCLVLTATQQVELADSAVIRDVNVRYNVFRECAQGFMFVGSDALTHESARSGAVSITNNLWYNIGGALGSAPWATLGAGGAPRQTPNRAPYNFTFEHNTAHTYPTSTPPAALQIDYCHAWPVSTPSTESVSTNTRLANNIWYSGDFGWMSVSPAAASCGTGFVIGRIGLPPLGSGSLVTHNALVGDLVSTGRCSANQASTTNTTCPTITDVETNTFTGPLTTFTGFTVKSTSTYYQTGTDGLSFGANITEVNTGVSIAMSGNNSGGGGGGGTAPTITTASPLPRGMFNRAITPITFAASNCGTGCTWAIEGAQPNGLTTSSAGVQTGTPTTPGIFLYTVRATASNGVSSTKQFTQEILSTRPIVVNGMELGLFKRSVAPTCNTDQVRSGDLWWDEAGSVVNVASVGCPSIVWTTLGGGGATTFDASAIVSGVLATARLGAGTADSTTFLRGDSTWAVPAGGGGGGTASGQVVPFTMGAPVGQDNIPVGGAEWPGDDRQRVRAVLTGMTSCALTARIIDAGLTTLDAVVQYWDAGTSTWGSTGISLPIGATGGRKEGVMQTLTNGAKIDTWYRVYMDDGDGVDDIIVTNLHMTCKP